MYRMHEKVRSIVIFPLFMVLLSLTFVSAVKAGSGADEKGLVLGLVPEINIFEQRKRYKPLMKYLSGKIDIPVRMKIYESYFRVIESLRDGDADMAFVGSLNYVIANDVAGAEVLARPEWTDGVSTYSGLIFARKGTGLTSDPSTWKGKKMALVHKFTTAGDLFQRQYMIERGFLKPEKLLDEIDYEGSHDAAIMMVFKGDAHIGGAKDLVFKRLVRENLELKEALVVLAESDRVPSNGLVVSRSIDGETKNRLKAALLNMDKEAEGKKALAGFGAKRFLDTDKEDYKAVYRMMESIGKTAADYFEGYGRKVP